LPAIGHRLPESDDMWTVCSGLSAQLRDLAAVHAELASACEEFAHHLDRVHSEVIGELRSLVEWSAAIQAAGGLLSFVTVGVAEVPTQAAQAARVARAAATVGACIERFVATARTLAAGVGRLVERADGVGARLRVFVGARLAEPALAGVGPMRVLSEAREVRALGRLEVAATDDVRVFADKTAARSGLDGALRTASNRFFRDATGKCRDFRIARLPGGHFRMEFFAPATNAGYGKLYVQVIDSTGRVTVEFKDTMGPAGLIERKWLHGQPE
jgi:hypothetical protein